MSRLLFISGSIGLGHIWRDIQIARCLRRHHPDVEISWLADHPATLVLEENGEYLLPEHRDIAMGTEAVDGLSSGFRTNNLSRWAQTTKHGAPHNVEILRGLLRREGFDLIIGDETYDLGMELFLRSERMDAPYIELYDFLGLDAMRPHLSDRLSTFLLNRRWYKYISATPRCAERFVFLGEPEDIPDRRFGPLLPHRRRFARRHIDFAGYVLPFDPAELADQERMKRELRYGMEPLVICSVGGTAAGKPLLDLCVKAFRLVRKDIPDLRMVLACGPRVDLSGVEREDGVEVQGYVPELYRHFAAADLCVVAGGGSTTLELTALRRPFTFFPLEEHSEQHNVALRCKRHNAGTMMHFPTTDPTGLAEAIVRDIGRPVSYAHLPLEGARKVTSIARGYLN